MNESHNPMDKAFREKLQDHEVQPDEHIWEGISKAVNKKSRRLWLILAPALILLGAALFYFIWSSTTGEEKGVSEVEHTTEQPSIQSHNDTRVLKVEDLAATSQNKEELPSSVQSNQVDKITNEHKTDNSALETNQVTNTVSKETISDQSRGNEQINDQAKVSDQATSNSSASSTNSISSSTSTQSNLSKNAVAQQANNSKSISASSNIQSNYSISYSRPVYELGTEPMASNNGGLHRFEISHFRNSERKQKEILNSNDQCALLYPKTNECPAFEDKNRRFQFDVYGLVGKKFSTLSTNDHIDGIDDYLNSRRSSETPLWNIGLGLRLSTQWTNGVSLRGGIEISQGQIRLNYNDETQKRVVVTVTQDTIVDEEGNITIIQDTTSITETNIIPVEDFNKFTQLDIPLTIGYTFLGREYDIELNAGVMFNLLFEKSGTVFNSEDELQSIDPSESGAINAYRQQLGLSIITSAAINYHITDQFSVFAEPQLRYFLKPVSPELYELNESWFHVNLMLGGRYSF